MAWYSWHKPQCDILTPDERSCIVTLRRRQNFWALATAALIPLAFHELGLTRSFPFLSFLLICSGELIMFYRTVGLDRLTISGQSFIVRRELFGIGFSQRFSVCSVRRFIFIDEETFDSRVRCLYFESDFLPHTFAHGIRAEDAAAVLQTVQSLIPGLTVK
jgi:hypothetical protein